MKKEILERLNQNGIKSCISFYSKKKDKLIELKNLTLFLDGHDPSISERLYCIMNDITELKICNGCKIDKVNFKRYPEGYLTYCSSKCAANSKDVRNKSTNTINKKYGSRKELDQIRHEKRKISNMRKYGVEFTLQNKDVRKRIVDTNLLKYGETTPLKNETIKNKIKETVYSKYGVDNVSKCESIKIQKTATTFSNYGVAYAYQSDALMDKMKQTMLERYGVDHNSKRKSTLDKRSDTWMKKYGIKNPIFKTNNSGVSKISQELFWKIYNSLTTKELKSKTYFHELNKEFDLGNADEYYRYDFVNTELKICIEFNGDYWHCNPELFEESYKNTMLNKAAKEIWEYDKNKLEFIKKQGYQIFVVWESEYEKNTEEILLKIMTCLSSRK